MRLQADIVGLMRDGKLLAESSPEELMSRYNKQSLEAVFLELCRNHMTLDERSASLAAISLSNLQSASSTDSEKAPLLTNAAATSTVSVEKPKLASRISMPTMKNVSTLTLKNFTRMRFLLAFFLVLGSTRY